MPAAWSAYGLIAMTNLKDLPGKREITEWFDAYVRRAGSLARLQSLTPDKMYTLMGSTFSWYWDAEDVGRAPGHDGSPDNFSGLYLFLGQLLESRRTPKP